MHIATVSGEKRTPEGRNGNERLRRRGMIPAIVYGHGEAAETIALSRHDLDMALRTASHVVNVKLDGKETTYLLKEIQYDHLQRTPMHADLMRVDPNERVRVKVRIEVRGTPVGIVDGGELSTPITDLEIECPLLKIPESVRVKVDHLKIGQGVHVRELELPEGVVALHDPNDVVAGCRVKRIHEEVAAAAPAAEGAAPAEPEVLARGKKEDEEEAKE